MSIERLWHAKWLCLHMTDRCMDRSAFQDIYTQGILSLDILDMLDTLDMLDILVQDKQDTLK